MIDKQLVKEGFSRCAPYYDSHSIVQRRCASALLNRIEQNGFSDILEIGCGTGNCTGLLRKKFPRAKIKAVDISFEMIKIAEGKPANRGIEFITADGETVEFEQRFNLLASNVSFQWFADLASALSRYKRLLNKNGLICFSQFGPRTFFELAESMRELFGREAAISSHSFITEKKLKRILEGIFREARVEQRFYQERHNSLPELLKKIKHTSVKVPGRHQRGLWTAKAIDELEKIYREKFKGIIASYQAFFCRGVK